MSFAEARPPVAPRTRAPAVPGGSWADRNRAVVIPLALALGAWAAIFHGEISAAVAVWLSSTAYGHCFLVLPLALYLAWTRRAAVAAVPVRPAPWAALGGIPLAVAWFAADRLGIMEGRQFAALGFLELLFLAVLGWRLCRALAAPLLYLVFLVPFGTFLTAPLQDFTAWFIAVGLDVLGIPHFADALTIETPQGVFYVAEACAGLRFLIASVAFGALYACLLYRSPARRAGFILAAMIVPVLANGLRGLGIVVLGVVLGSAQAAAADHLVYGWAFFSVVILLLVLAGLPWREDGAVAATEFPTNGVANGASPRRPASAFWAALALAVPAVLGPGAVALLDRGTAPPATPALAFATPAGCVATEPPAAAQPNMRHFRCGGLQLDVTLDLFSPHTTLATLLAAERQANGTLAALEVAQTTLVLAAGEGEPRRWRLAETAKPDQTTASAIWIDGAPSPGGLAARLRQGWNSLGWNSLGWNSLGWNSLGGRACAPALLTLQVRAADQGPLDRAAREQARGLLRRALAGEPALAARIGRLACEAAGGR